MRATKTALRLAVAALAWGWLAAPVLADDPPAAPTTPPSCQGLDLFGPSAVRPEALAQAEAQRAGQLDNSQGLLWRIEKAGRPPSYLFGTVHSTDDRAIALAKEAATHIQGVNVVATELGGPLDKFAMAEMGAKTMVRALAKEGDTLAVIGAPDDLALVEKYLATRGVDASLAHHLKLWFLAILAGTPSCEMRRQQFGLPFVDDLIARSGKDLGVKVVGLETVDEQMDILASIEPSLAATILLSSVRRPGFDENFYSTMLDYYAKKDAGEILPLLDASGLLTPQESKAEDEFTALLLGGRNEIMVDRLAPLLDGGPVFVAVGALHLIGKGGLVELLRARGYTVTNLW